MLYLLLCRHSRTPSESALLLRKKSGTDSSIDIEAMSEEVVSDTSEERKSTLRFLVLDCKNLKGVDATAAKRCFCELYRFAEKQDINIVFSACSDNVLSIMESHGALVLPWTRHIENIYEALDHCETALLAEIVVDTDKRRALSFTSSFRHDMFDRGTDGTAGNPHEFKSLKRALTLRMSKRFTVAEIFQIFFEISDDEVHVIEGYAGYYEEYELEAETLLFALMDDPDCFYIILEVKLFIIIFQNSKKLIYCSNKFVGGSSNLFG